MLPPHTHLPGHVDAEETHSTDFDAFSFDTAELFRFFLRQARSAFTCLRVRRASAIARSDRRARRFTLTLELCAFRSAMASYVGSSRGKVYPARIMLI